MADVDKAGEVLALYRKLIDLGLEKTKDFQTQDMIEASVRCAANIVCAYLASFGEG